METPSPLILILSVLMFITREISTTPDRTSVHLASGRDFQGLKKIGLPYL